MNSINYKRIGLSGDASSRKFFRKIYDNNKNRIVVISKKEKFKNLILYDAINKLLLRNKILAPKLYDYSLKNGFIEISDFGNQTFYEIIKKKKSKIKIYKKILDLLIKIQKINHNVKIKTLLGKSHKLTKYSLKVLHSESDLFFDWYLQQVIGKQKANYVKKISKPILNKLYKKLIFKNNIFVHRDFHVSNLMWVNKKIGIIDSQDALIGNPAYDLVSLVDDVRIVTSNDVKKKICNYYFIKSPLINKFNKEDFIKDFNILAVQRSLKIIGIFSRLFLRDKKNQYLKLIPYCWKLLENRYKYKGFSDLKLILDHYVPKKIRKKTII